MQLQRKPGIPFVLVTVFLDTLAFGFVIPVLPALVATMTPDKQSQAYWYGLLLGSLNSISSIMGVIAPLVGSPILAAVSGLSPNDWRIGATFFVAALAQALALGQAVRHFRHT